MTEIRSRITYSTVLLCLCGGWLGCGEESVSQKADSSAAKENTVSENAEKHDHSKEGHEFKPVTLGSHGMGGENIASALLTPEQKVDTVLKALKPLQVLVGDWRGVTRKNIAGAVSVETPQWKRDFKTNSEQPALLVTSKTSPYLKEGRLTYLIDTKEYQFSATDRHGVERTYLGTFSEPVKEFIGDDKRLQRAFKLQLVQSSPDDGKKIRQVVFNQQENNRYLLEIYDERGGRMLRFDTVNNQREGTSFAINPNDYREKECVISGGLGTMTVSHNGQTYYVCCSGCRDAFNDDPETWIARHDAKKTTPR